MTAYELFEMAYMRSMRQFMSRHPVQVTDFNMEELIVNYFAEDVEDYVVDFADSTGIVLVHDGNPEKIRLKVVDLKNIEVETGYWLCHYDGHTDDWMLFWHDSKSEAKAAYKQLYSMYFRQLWRKHNHSQLFNKIQFLHSNRSIQLHFS